MWLQVQILPRRPEKIIMKEIKFKKDTVTFEGNPCKICGTTLRYKSGACTNSRNHPSQKKSRAKWTIKNRDKMKWWRIKTKYGISEEQWNEMYSSQKGKCKICNKVMKKHWAPVGRDPTFKGSVKKWRSEIYIDHCHQTSVVRGLLCASCNTIIGHAKDDTNILYSAIEYLNINNLKKENIG